MSDATVARMIGSLFAVAGMVLAWASMANDWSLFLLFGVALLAIAAGFQIAAWSWRRNSGPGSPRDNPAR